MGLHLWTCTFWAAFSRTLLSLRLHRIQYIKFYSTSFTWTLNLHRHTFSFSFNTILYWWVIYQWWINLTFSSSLVNTDVSLSQPFSYCNFYSSANIKSVTLHSSAEQAVGSKMQPVLKICLFPVGLALAIQPQFHRWGSCKPAVLIRLC
jgi:hypothetical protein